MSFMLENKQISISPWLKNIEVPCFFESYRDWIYYGWGTMLVHYDGKICTYVRFTNEQSGAKEVLSEGLLNQYLREVRNER